MVVQFLSLFFQLLMVSLFTWLPVSLILGWVADRKFVQNYPRLVNHLKEGPIIAGLTFCSLVFSYHLWMVGVSHYGILSYIYFSPTNEFSQTLSLHLPVHSFCGNANDEWIHDLYSSTATVGLESSDSNVRARSLRMTLRFYPGLNGYSLEGKFKEMIDRLKLDPSPEVQAVIEENRELIERTCGHSY